MKPVQITIWLFLAVAVLLSNPAICSTNVKAFPELSERSTSISSRKSTPVTTLKSTQIPAQPIHFEPNAGQLPEEVVYSARGPGYQVFLTQNEAVLNLQKPSGSSPNNARVVRIKPVGSTLQYNSTPLGKELQPGVSNYFLGNDSKKWKAGIAHYSKVRYNQIYPGIDLEYYGNPHQLEYDFIVEPGANPDHIRLSLQGVDKVSIDNEGQLVMQLGDDTLLQRAPLIYQNSNGKRQIVAGDFTLEKAVQTNSVIVGFRIASYDKNRDLIIDPVLSWSSFLGGSNNDYGNAVAVDNSNHAYVTGSTYSLDFPTINGLYSNYGGGKDVFISKFGIDGSSLIYSTYLGGDSTDSGYDVAVDSSGNAYITGETRSSNFPTQNAYDDSLNGADDVFIAKINAAGNVLVYSSFLGGSNDDSGRGIAVNTSGNAYVTGTTKSIDFPATVSSYDDSPNGGDDAFAVKFSANGNSLVYSTYLGGNSTEEGNDIAVDSAGSAFLTGTTRSSNFPTTPGVFQAVRPGGTDAYAVKLNANGTALNYSTYLGSTSTDEATSIAIDSSGHAYLTGLTNSSNFPLSNSFDNTHNGSSDAFITKLNTNASALVYSSFLGGSNADYGRAIAVDAAGAALVSGETYSNNFPLENPIFGSYNSGSEVFVTKVQTNGAALEWSTYMDGNRNDFVRGMAVDDWGSVYITGYTLSVSYHTTAGAYDRVHNGGYDAFVTKIGPDSTSTFLDVPSSYWAYTAIERLFAEGITGGCSINPRLYCPTSPVTRAQMAIFLLRSIHGSAYNPPAATGTMFNDVPASYWAAAWIEQLANEGITSGCGNGNYCPVLSVTRAQMSVLLLRGKYGSSHTPPGATGIFNDVATNYWAANWIEKLYSDGITGGCSLSPLIYCPTNEVTRAQMAVFLVRTFLGNAALPGQSLPEGEHGVETPIEPAPSDL